MVLKSKICLKFPLGLHSECNLLGAKQPPLRSRQQPRCGDISNHLPIEDFDHCYFRSHYPQQEVNQDSVVLTSHFSLWCRHGAIVGF